MNEKVAEEFRLSIIFGLLEAIAYAIEHHPSSQNVLCILSVGYFIKGLVTLGIEGKLTNSAYSTLNFFKPHLPRLNEINTSPDLSNSKL